MKRARPLPGLTAARPALALLFAAGPACRADPAPERSAPPPGDSTSSSTRTSTAARIPWIHDDVDRALARAEATGRALVVDQWAPWCHTCLSMQEEVLTAPEIRALADRFVWLAVDTDRPENAEHVRRYPPVAWPTFLVLDPTTGAVRARLVGGASKAQFRAFLDAGAADRGSAAEAALRAAHAAEDEGAWAEAAAAYQQAIDALPEAYPRRPEVLLGRIRALRRAGAFEPCVELARRRGHETGRAAAAADFAFYALACARALDAPRAARAALPPLARRVTEAARAEGGPMSADDRSDALRIAREIALFLGEEAKARALAREQRAVVDAAMSAAESPAVASTFNWPAAEVYAFLGEHEALIPTLRRSVEALPDQYDPPYRLAWLLLEAGRPDEARPFAERARARVYGPRTAQVEALLERIDAARAAK